MGRALSPARSKGGTTKIQKLQRPLPVSGACYPGGRILSFDQGLMTTGFGFMEDAEITEHGIIKLPGKNHHQRYEKLLEVTGAFLDNYKPDLVIYETGGGFGGAGTPEAKRGMVLSEFAIAHVCFLREQEAGYIQNESLKYQVADKQRLLELKRQGLRNSVRPIKQDVHHELKRLWKLSEDFFFTEDHADAVALLYAYATNPSVAKFQ